MCGGSDLFKLPYLFSHMNKIDRKLYKALRFLSRHSTKSINRIRKEKPRLYKKFVPQDVEDFLHIPGDIQFNENNPQIIQISGLLKLRDLEEIKRKSLTIWISSIAIAIAFGSFIMSLIALRSN